jgi:reductive dehalogenase
MSTMKHNTDAKQDLALSRRNFLKVGVAAAAFGVVSAAAGPEKAMAASPNPVRVDGPKGEWSKLRPKADYGSARVRFVDQNNEWLGTTKIVGPIKRSHEADHGFNLSARGLISKKSQLNGQVGGGFVNKHPISGAISWGRTWIASEEAVDGEASPEGRTKYPIPDPETMSRHMKDLAYFLRSDEVGIGRMPEYAYWSHKVTNSQAMREGDIENCGTEFTKIYPYVISVMVDQNLETTLATTGYDGISASQSMLSYHATGNIAIIMARYIRSLGYNARAHHAANYAAAMPPALIASGLGELSRPGDCTVHPRLGFRHKVACVTTDMPLKPDTPIDFGMIDFCRVCLKCADECPNDSISFDREPVEYNGYLRWNSDMKLCTHFRTTNEEGSSCGRCMKVCPWNSKEDSWFHQAGTWLGSRGEASSTLLKNIDDMFGYGTEEIPRYKWWLEWPEQYKYPPGLDY